MMKNIFTIVILAIITLLGYIAVCAEPLAGDISSTEGGTSFGGKVWYASYMNLKQPRDFIKDEQLRIRLSGNAKSVYVRLLPKGAVSTNPTGIIDKRIHVPQEGVITVKLDKAYPNIQQVSVHSGHQAFQKLISSFNGNADIIDVEVVMDK